MNTLNFNNIIKQQLPNLINSDLNIIQNYVLDIIEYIISRFNIDIIQFSFEQFRDVKVILNTLLPFIDDSKYKLIYSIKDLSVVNNINYDRSYIIPNSGAINKKYEYKKLDLEHNYKLLLDTINVSSNKLYINWINVVPYLISEYKQSKLW